MKQKPGIVIIIIMAWVGVSFVLVIGYLGFDFISVASNSMKHENETLFVEFWNKRGCNITCARGFPIPYGFQGGDLLIQQRTSEYKIGDVLGYKSGCYCEDEENEKCQCYSFLIHRLLDMNETGAFFMGDNILWMNDNDISREAVDKKFITGKIIFKIPKLGLVRALINCFGTGCDSVDCIINGNCI